MNRLITLLVIGLLFSMKQLSANATLIVDASDKTVLQLCASHVEVNVVNQVATVKSTQRFVNQLGYTAHVKYAFPLYEDACATSLRWKLNGVWYYASFTPEPADTTLPGATGIVNLDLETYLGQTALYFELNDSIMADSSIVFELTYVQLLHYAYNEVAFATPNDYSLIQSLPLDTQQLSLHIISDRSIVSTVMISHPTIVNTFTDSTADVIVELFDASADADYNYTYTLNPSELGLFSFSTYLPDSINYCDDYGQGYFGFIVEPDPGDSAIINKIFTLIIDKSGSMGGEKISQAREAATFIVNNLNEGDAFNVISFDTEVESLFPDHVPVTIANQNAALDFINDIGAGGSTNISGSFAEAIPQFSDTDTDAVNVIIFMTDGQATVGITGTSEILDYIASLVVTNDVEGLSINTFGIGYDANEALLSQIASENNGICQFFAAGDLTAVITDFYLTIQNPVLINTSMTFSPDIVSETYPDPLPNLYKGHQLVVLGRYMEPGNVTVTFSGEKYGEIVNYIYSFDLSDSTIEQNAFLTKLWAIDKINDLMNTYYTFAAGSPESDSIHDFVTDLSICYSVISPFTSFTDNTGGGTIGIEELLSNGAKPMKSINYPNPFHTTTSIRFQAPALFDMVPCVILDSYGNIVTILEIFVTNAGAYQLVWNGTDANGNTVKAGVYPYYITIDGATIYGVMEKF